MAFSLGNSLASLKVRIGADLTEFKKGTRQMEAAVKPVADRMRSLGKTMSLRVSAPIAALGAIAVRNFDKQAKAVAQVEAGLRSTGNAAGFTSDQLQTMARDLQRTTLFGDEEILQGATAQLLTFTNIAGEQFGRTQKAALDLATRLDGDLKSASIQLGKALNDPVANLSALSRSGIQFSKDQKEVIKSLAEGGRMAEAQTVILDELEKQYGGAAEAAAKAGLGPFKQLSMSLGDLSEDFGKIIVEGLTPIVEKLKGAVEWVSNMDEDTKRVTVTILALTAAIGPLLVGLAAIVAIAPAVATAWGLIMGPVGLALAVAALAAAAVSAAKKLGEEFEKMGASAHDAAAAIGGIPLDHPFVKAGQDAQEAAAGLEAAGHKTKWLSRALQGAGIDVGGMSLSTQALIKNLEGMGEAATKKAASGLTEITEEAKKAAARLAEFLAQAKQFGGLEMQGLNLSGFTKTVSQVDLQTGKITKRVKLAESGFWALGNTLRETVAPAADAVGSAMDNISTATLRANAAMAELGAELKHAIGSIGIRAVDGLAFAIGDAIVGFESFGKAVKRIMRALIADLIAAIAKLVIMKVVTTAIGAATGGGGAVVGALANPSMAPDLFSMASPQSFGAPAASGAGFGGMQVVITPRSHVLPSGDIVFSYEQGKVNQLRGF